MSLLRALGVTAVALICALVSSASSPACAGDVVVYSSRDARLIEPLLRVFESLTGNRVTFTYVGADIVAALQKEGAGSKADLLIASDFSQLVRAKQAGLTRQASVAALDERIPDVYRDTSGHWYALTRRAMVLVVPAKKDLPALAEPSYEALADPSLKGRICLNSGKTPDNIALVASIVAHDGIEEAQTWLKAVKANLARKPSGTEREQVVAVNAGVCDVTVVNSYHIAEMLKSARPEMKAAAEGVRVLMPNVGDRGTHVTISGMALAKSAQHVAEAELLMDFLTSRPAQKIFAQDNEEYPAREDEKPSQVVASWGTLEAENIPLSMLSLLFPQAVEALEKSQFDSGPGG